MPEVQAGQNVNQQLVMCADLCVLRGRILARFEARHPEFIAELRELERDSEPEEPEEEVETNNEEL